jgi:hypothetical protein
MGMERFVKYYDTWLQHLSPNSLPTYDQLQSLITTLCSSEKRGPKASPLGTSKVNSGHILLIKEFIKKRLEEGKSTFNKNIRSLLSSIPNPVHISRNVVARLMKAIGYVYEKRNPMLLSPERMQKFKLRIRQFLLEYSTAARDPSLVKCFMDESFLHHHHAFDGGYFPSDPDVRCMRRGRRGRRHIIVHAITEDGPLHVNKDLTCEWIFPSNSGLRDYHTNMNGDNFMKWVKERFVPTFEAKYPSKRAALILDNAPYHHTHDPNTYLNVKTMSKVRLLDTMKRIQLSSITIERKGANAPICFELEPWFQRGQVPNAPAGPSKVEMQDALLKILRRDHPSLLNTRLMNLFQEKQWILIFTPPYSPQYQPIELVWAHCKGYVAMNYHNQRTMESTAEQFRAALYGNHDASHKQLDTSALIRHCEREMLAAATLDNCLQPHLDDVRCLMRKESASDDATLDDLVLPADLTEDDEDFDEEMGYE